VPAETVGLSKGRHMGTANHCNSQLYQCSNNNNNNVICLHRSPGQPQHLKYQNRIWWIL